MPPKKQVLETPVVFTFRFPDENVNTPQPAGAFQEYSEILQQIDTSTIPTQFKHPQLKTIFERNSTPTYSSSTVCFWCCHPFSWSPCSVPISYDTYKLIYTCEGHFCSPECGLAYTYADASLSDSVRWNRQTLLNDMYRELYGERDLLPAPHHLLLRMFGGQLDIIQFRQCLTNGEELARLHMPPVRMNIPVASVQPSLRDIRKHTSFSQDVFEKASTELRLKRTKQTPNSSTLDKCLNIGS